MRYRRSGGFGQLSIRDQISIFGRAGQSPYLSCSWGHGRREFRHSEPAPKVRHVSRTESKKLVQETTPSFSVPASCTQEVAKGRIAWLCSRNDLINNSGVLVAAGLVALTGSRWPDLVVGAGVAVLFLWTACSVLRGGWKDLRESTTTSKSTNLEASNH